MFDLGLVVAFNGEKNTVWSDSTFKTYPIGGMMCEYARLKATELKNIILGLSHFNAEWDTDNLSAALIEFHDALFKEYGVVVANIVTADFYNYLYDFNRATNEELVSMLKSMDDDIECLPIRKFIFEDTGFTEFGITTIGQGMLGAYYNYAYDYACFKVTLDVLVSDGKTDKARMDGFISMYAENSDIQHIDFKIVCFEGSFNSVFTIKSTLSLALFEAANIVNGDVCINKCKNCGGYFIPVGRVDKAYCGFPSPQDKNKTCREVGAQATMAHRLKSDTVTQEYRRLYMRLKMAIKRHPDNQHYQNQLGILTEGMKTRRKRRKNGELSDDDILEWLADIEASGLSLQNLA